MGLFCVGLANGNFHFHSVASRDLISILLSVDSSDSSDSDDDVVEMVLAEEQLARKARLAAAKADPFVAATKSDEWLIAHLR